MKSRSISAILLTLLLLSGCAVTRKVVGEAAGYSDLYYGEVVMDMAGSATMRVASKKSGVTCSGNARITHYGVSMWTCAGQGGKFRSQCTDGRQIIGTYEVETCDSGFGEGKDQDGNVFTFVFGLDEQEAEKRIKARQAQIAERPILPEYNPKSVRKEKGFVSGTGFFVSNDGHLVTNYHVVDGAASIAVLNPQKRTEAKALLVKADPANDIAILKIDEATIGIPLSSSFTASKGDEVLTLGYPLLAIQGQEQKATFGRVNALSGIGNDIRYSQIDVPIQPGNSGGPLMNDRGEVIGVVTATLNQMTALKSSGSLPQNVNYAIKVDYVLPVLNAAKIDRSGVGGGAGSKLDMPRVVALREASVVIVISK